MQTRLKIRFPKYWCLESNSDGLITIFRDAPDTAGSLQMSIYAEYKGGKTPNPTGEQLLDLAKQHGERNDAGELIDTAHGTCQLGAYGTAIFRDQEFPWIQLWYLSNGHDFVLATYICEFRPSSLELKEANDIVQAIRLAPNPYLPAQHHRERYVADDETILATWQEQPVDWPYWIVSTRT